MKTSTQNNTVNAFEGSTTKNVLSAIAFRYLPFWPIFVFTIITSLVISYFYIHYQTPIYEASATILLKDQNGGGTDASVLQALGVSNSAKTVENEIEVIKSRILMQQVVKDMSLYAQVYNKGTFRDVLIYPSPVTFVALNPDNVPEVGSVPVSFSYLNSHKAIVLGGKKYPLSTPVHTPYGDYIINPTKEGAEMQFKGEYYAYIRSIKPTAKTLLGVLKVAPAARNSSLIALNLADQVPARAEDILNNLVRIYNEAGISYKNATGSNTLAFINERLISVTKELSTVEGNLADYRKQKGITNLSAEGLSYMGSAQQNVEKLAQIQIQLDVLTQVEKYVIKKGAGSALVPSTLGLNDPLLSQLLDKLYSTELELTTISKTSGENSPTVNAIKERIAQIKPGILENLRALRQNLIATQSRLQAEGSRTSEQLRDLPQKERVFLEITRNRSIKDNIYTLLLTKREEVQLSRAASVADSRIVNFAENKGGPIKPIPLNIYLMGLSVGVIAGVIFVLIREQYNQEVLFRSEIEKATDATVLAEILHDDSGKTLVIKDGSRTVIAEQFRALRTALNFIGIQGNHKTILLTSSISGEGKSFTAINLAVSLALTGKKVAVMEFDLRKPKISKMMEINQEPGISNYLAGLAAYEQITISMADRKIPGLVILPAGAIPPNPTELMLNGRLDVLMAKLNEDFDYILIDSPPIGLVTDAKIINKYVNACLYMVRHKYTPKYYLNLIDHLYSNKELTNISIVFNGLKMRGVLGGYRQGYGSGYGYGYGYGAGAGYGYGYTNDEKTKQSFALKVSGVFKRSK
jgi:tyrosine-protein kinase Etk/Wzc